MGRARIDWRKKEVTSRTRGEQKNSNFTKLTPRSSLVIRDEKLPTQLEVSLPFSHAQVLQLIKKELTELSERGQKKHSAV